MEGKKKKKLLIGLLALLLAGGVATTAAVVAKNAKPGGHESSKLESQIESESDVESVISEDSDTDVSAMETIVKQAYELAEDESMEGTQTLTGVITVVNTSYDANYGNITVTIVVGELEDYPVKCYRLAGDGVEDLAKGDTITVEGTLTNYKGTIEFAQGCKLISVVKGEGGDEPEQDLTTEEIITAAKALKSGEALDQEYALTGKITKVVKIYDYEKDGVTTPEANFYMEVNGVSFYCYATKGDHIKEIAVGDTATVKGQIKNYNGTIEFNLGTMISWTSGGGKQTEAEPTYKTVAEILAAAQELKTDEVLDDGYEYTLTGEITAVTKIYDYTDKSGKVIPEADFNIVVNGVTITCYATKGTDIKNVVKGDTATVKGSIKNYGGKIEFDKGTLVKLVKGSAPEENLTTPAEIVNAAYALEVGDSLQKEYTLTGTISKIDTPWDSSFKNISVLITVEGKEILCYRMKAASGVTGVDGLDVGDTITCKGRITKYQKDSSSPVIVEFTQGCECTNIQKAVLSYTVTAVSADTEKGTVAVDGYKITVTPKDGFKLKDCEVTEGTATTSINENIITVTPTTNCTVKVNFEEADPFPYAEGTAYKYILDIKPQNKIYFFDGGINTNEYLTSTDKLSNAVDVYLEKVTDGYRLYFYKDTVKTYIEIYKTGTKFRPHLATEPTFTYTYHDVADTFYGKVDGTDYYIGTYTNNNGDTFTTFSASKLTFITGENAEKVDVSQFPARLYTAEPVTTATITYVVNGTELNSEDVTLNVEFTLPTTATEIPNYTFVGWVSEEVLQDTTVLPTIVTKATPTADTTYYALYKQSSWKLGELTDGATTVITEKVGDEYYAMSNDNGTSKAPTAVSVTVTVADNDQYITSEVPANIQWVVSSPANGQFIFNAGENYLYSISENNGLRVGTGEYKIFDIDQETGYLHHVYYLRYVGIYMTNTEWRSYTSVNTNIQKQTLGFYIENATYTTAPYVAPEYAVTTDVNNPDFGSIVVNGYSINATPIDGYRIKDCTITPTDAATYTIDNNIITLVPQADCAVVVNFEPIPYAEKITQLVDGDDILIVINNSVMTLTAQGNTLAGVAPVFNGEKLEIARDLAVLKVVMTEGGFYLKTADGKYLTSGPTGSALTLETAVGDPDYAMWKINEKTEGTVIESINAKYNNKTQVLEYFNSKFTTYSYQANNSANFIVTLYSANGAPAPIVITAATADETQGTVALEGNVITATPADGYKVKDCMVAPEGAATCEISGNTITVTATADCTVTVNFEAATYTVQAQANNANYGTFEVEGYTITATPAAGYKFVDCTLTDGTATWNVEGNVITVTPTANCVITVNFAALTDEDYVTMAYALASGESLSAPCTLTGTITKINTAWSPNYKNITVTIVVDNMTDNAIQCFRMTAADPTDTEQLDALAALKVGDVITVFGVLKNYNGTIEFDTGCIGTPYVPTVTAQSADAEKGTVSLEGNVITATPVTGYVVEGCTIAPVGAATCIIDGNTITVTATADCTITVNFAAAPTTAHVVLMVNGTEFSSSDVTPGEEFNLMDPEKDYKDRTFVGWSTTEYTEETTEEPTVLNGKTTITEDTTFYAVYSYTIEVPKPGTYKLVKDSSQLAAGKKVVITAAVTADNPKLDYAMSTTQNNNNRGQVAIERSGDTITFAADAGVCVLELQVGTDADTFAFYDALYVHDKGKGGYLFAAGGTGKNNWLRTEKDLSANSSFVVTTYENGISDVVSIGGAARNVLMYNKSNSIFACYASGQTDVSLYVYTESTETMEVTAYITNLND